MKRLCIVIAGVIGLTGIAPVEVAGAASDSFHVVISELQTGTAVSASQEFIELYNPGDMAVALSNWTMEYKPATAQDVASSWNKKATLTGSIVAHGFYLIAPKSFLPVADSDWSATLASTGGVIRLKNDAGTVVDKLGYGSTTVGAESVPADAPATGQSIERLPGWLQELAGNGVDTDNNSADFIVRTVPVPQSTASPVELPGAVSTNDPNVVVIDDPVPATTPTAFAPIEITEILPNPMSPQTDADDEYIELFNPTADPANLKGYILKTGSNFHDYYVLPDLQIAPSAYVVLYSRQTKLAMPNSGGAVELLDPTGSVSDVTPAYGSAPDGQAWANFEGEWSWTLQMTPGQPNVFVSLTANPDTAKVAKPKTSTVKKSLVTIKQPKSAVKKATKKPKVTKPKTTKTKTVLPVEPNLQPATWLIIVLAALTITYAIYEFRHDIINCLLKLRGDSRVRPAPQPAAERRGDD